MKFLQFLWSILKKLGPIIPWATLFGGMGVTWVAMGSAGYRAGNRVAAGPVALDPELMRMLASIVVGGVGLLITKLPYGDVLQGIWDQIRAKPVPPDPLTLTGAEQRDQYERVCTAFPKPTDAMTKG